MRIAIIGSRGIPNQYGGFEELSEKLSIHLKKKGHEPMVYASHKHPYQESEYQGVQIIHKYDPENWMGSFGQFIYDLICIIDSRKRDFDVILQLGYTSSSIWWWLFPRKVRVLTNMDGLEWKRSKYNKLTRRYLRYAEKLAAKHSHLLVADNIEIEHYLQNKFINQKVTIPYGADIPTSIESSHLNKYGVQSKKFKLLIARMEPENNIETVIKGVISSKSKAPLIVIGNLDTGHGKYLVKKYQDPKIRFCEAEYNKEILNSLRQSCSIYFHGHSVGGTNPALLEAMAAQSFIVAHDNPFNRATLANNAQFFSDASDITKLIDKPLESDTKLTFIKNNLTLIRERYNWKIIGDQYEVTMQQLMIG